MSLLAFWWIAQVVSPVSSSTAKPGTSSSAAPLECSEVAHGSPENPWERAKRQREGGFCSLIATAETKLGSQAPLGVKQASILADQAAAIRPESALPHVIRGRALMREGKFGAARTELAVATSAVPELLRVPDTLFAWAHTTMQLGDFVESRRAYARLLPSANLISKTDQPTALLDAAWLFMAEGPGSLDSAIATLRELHAPSAPTVRVVTALALALALDRKGARDEAQQLLGPQIRAGAAAAIKDAMDAKLVPAEEVPALLAMSFEGLDVRLAKEHWREVPQGVWRSHAELRLDPKASSKSTSKMGSPSK